MHHHLEIVMPPTDDIEGAVAAILEPFDENNEEGSHQFWDFYNIGGRFAGQKLQASVDPEKLDKFYEVLKEKKVTVSGLQCGKPELKPASQIPLVDALWQEHFPETGNIPCPLFNHSNDQYDSKSLLPEDVCRLDAAPVALRADRVIFAGPDYKGEGVEATYMVSDSIWNGVDFEKTEWDGSLKDARELFTSKTENYAADYRERVTPKDDWLVVTVDYHS